MLTFRHLMVATLALVVLASATPVFAQTDSTPTSTPSKLNLKLNMPGSFAPELTPAQTPREPKQGGIGVFVQGGYVYQTTYTGGAGFDSDPQGVMFGIGFGGNKNGVFGIGADLNYVWTNNSDNDQKTQYLNIPVYGRINIGGYNTKNSFTFYIPFGWYFDVNLSNQIDGIDVKELFGGLQTGPLVGAGFEVFRIGIEGRAQWALTQLLADGQNNFLDLDSKQFTFILLFKVRLN